jgi:squalene cyclase
MTGAQAQAARASIVAPAQRSASAKLKLTKQTADGLKVHSFQTLIGDLATIRQKQDSTHRQKLRRLRYAHRANRDSATRIGFARRHASTQSDPGFVGSKPRPEFP